MNTNTNTRQTRAADRNSYQLISLQACGAGVLIEKERTNEGLVLKAIRVEDRPAPFSLRIRAQIPDRYRNLRNRRSICSYSSLKTVLRRRASRKLIQSKSEQSSSTPVRGLKMLM